MSVINQMLKDLDKRRKGKSSNPAKGLKATARPVKSKSLPYTIGACVIVIGVVGYWFAHSETLKAPEPNLTAHKAKMAKIVAAAKKIKPTISQVTYTEQSGKGTLTLKLTHNPHITMGVSDDHHLLTLDTGNNVLKATLPKITGHDIIDSMQFQAGKLQINLASDVVVQSLNTQHHKPFSVTLSLAVKKPAQQKAKPQALAQTTPVQAVKKVIPLSPEVQMNQTLNHILDNISAKQKGAVLALRNFVNQNPAYIPGTHALATYYASEKQYSKAIQLINSALQNNADNIPLITLKAQALLAQNKPEAAEALLANYSPEVKTYPMFYELMAATEQQLGKSELAAQYYQELIGIDSSNGKYWLGYGLSLAQLGKNNAALRAFKQALISEHVNANLKAFLRTQIEQLGA